MRILVSFVCLLVCLVVSTSVRAAGETGASGAATTEEVEPEQGVAGAVKLIQEALRADREGKLEECIEKDKAALKIDEMPRTRLHLASCESRNGKLVDALKDARKALEVGIQRKDAAVMRVASVRVKELLERIPHVTFTPPGGVGDLSVKFDDRPVPVDALTKRFSVDPGRHTVTAEGSVNGFPAAFSEDYEIKERALITIRITLKPIASDFITPDQIKCMLVAKSQEEIQKCIPQNRKSLVVRVAADLSGYTDTNSVALYTPAVNLTLLSPTNGWNVGANFQVDAVSAASPDIVATASPPFKEYRYAGGLTGGYKAGLYGIQGSGSLSSSPDYVSHTVGVRVLADLLDKQVTPSLGYSYSWDRIGRGPDNFLHDFNDLKGKLDTHEFEAGVTFVMNSTTLLVVGGTLTLERGDQSQPYRYVPTFDPGVSGFVRNGSIIDLVNEQRLPMRPLEQLPTERDRYAIGARLNKRMNNATLRIEERLYTDTWAIQATSTDARYMVDLTRSFRVWPHVRLHAQNGANFYRSAYSATVDPGTGDITVPTYRTADRELSPLLTGTGGGGMRIALSDPDAEFKYGVTLVGDFMYTRYLKALYVTARTAVYGSAGFDMEF